uniref:Uncharacterized protein n=1 Tax=Oryza punctata TaxID=4537 RepID=A0A0E0JYV5_ORYPU
MVIKQGISNMVMTNSQEGIKNFARGARQLTRHLRFYGSPKFEGVSSDDGGSEEILEGFIEKEMESKAINE